MAFETNRQGYWKFDESSGNAVDSSGNGNTLTPINTPTFVSGKVNNAANFVRASEQYFSITDANQTGLDITGDISISLWVNLASQPSDQVYEFCNKSNESGDERAFSYYYRDSGGKKYVRFVVGAKNGVRGNDLYDIPLELPTGGWTHIIMTWDASAHTASLYKDGSLVGTSTGTLGSTDIYESTSNFQIGVYWDPTMDVYHPMDGMLDEFMIWDRVITSHEVRTYYNSVILPNGLSFPAFFEE